MWSPQMGHLRVSARLATQGFAQGSLDWIRMVGRGVPRLVLGVEVASADVEATILCSSASRGLSESADRSARARFFPRQLFSTPYTGQYPQTAGLRRKDARSCSAGNGFAPARGDYMGGCWNYGTCHMFDLRGERDGGEGGMLSLPNRWRNRRVTV